MKVAVIGVGLIGGSMALKFRQKNFADFIYGIDNDPVNINDALALGIVDVAADIETGIKDSDLVILAVPVDASLKLLPKVLDLVNSSQTVMDVGSTKFEIAKAVKNHRNRGRFVAFHPMWGTENSGAKSALADSFTGRTAVICDGELSDENALKTADLVAKTLEMKVIFMSSEDHDIHAAYISHISHITSYALANTVLEKEREEDKIFQLASSGFSSTVRLAKSHPEMWVPIFRQNKENVLDVLNEHIAQLHKFKSTLEKEDYSQMKELIINANKIRGILK